VLCEGVCGGGGSIDGIAIPRSELAPRDREYSISSDIGSASASHNPGPILPLNPSKFTESTVFTLHFDITLRCELPSLRNGLLLSVCDRTSSFRVRLFDVSASVVARLYKIFIVLSHIPGSPYILERSR